MLRTLICACAPVLLLSVLMVFLSDVAVAAVAMTVVFVVALLLISGGILKRAVRKQDITLTLITILKSMTIRLAGVVAFALWVSEMPAADVLIALVCISVAISVIADAFTFIAVEEEPLHA
ncbi:MAG: hypothetical protein HRU15_18070 [Planctomycetes bacterium]|nr:hypothetical protein [Planctomycetota bacterium]